MSLNTYFPVRIGTSGIVVPGVKADFPEEFKDGSYLHYYASLFNTLEINKSFYKIPMPTTFEKWAQEVPEDFKFTVKFWKGITHAKNLQFKYEDIDSFMSAVTMLGNKAGCLLIQFPASINVNYLKQIEEIISYINNHNVNKQWLLAVEFRHMSWYQKIVYDVLTKYKASIVFHDMPGSATPPDAMTSDFIYLRFHGPTGNYNGSYSSDAIKKYAEHIKKWQKDKNNIYVYFNNTIGSAFDNAKLLQQLL